MFSKNMTTCVIALLGATLLPLAGQAKDKKSKTKPKDPQDSIEVVGHVPVANGPIVRFLATPHYSSYYLYAEHQANRNVTLIDITQPGHPAVLSDVSTLLPGPTDSLSVVAGTAAVVTSAPAAASGPETQTIRIMDFSDPLHPKVVREFAGVTATSRDDRRGLIFVANDQGIWILQQHLAIDPAVEKAYSDYVIYGSR